MAQAPLGPHFTRKAKTDIRVTLKPAAAFYTIQVRLPDSVIAVLQRRLNDPSQVVPSSQKNALLWSEGGAKSPPASYSASYEKVIAVSVPSEASADTVVGHILKKVGYTDRTPNEFMLVQCFADFTLDVANRSLFGDGAPIKYHMGFPFFLSLQVNPYVLKREDIDNKIEPNARNAIANEQRKFFVFAAEYAVALSKLHSQYLFFTEREAEARRTKKEQERRDFFDVSQVTCFRAEKEARTKLRHEEEENWQNLALHARSILNHQAYADSAFQAFSNNLDNMMQALRKTVRDCAWLATLHNRYHALVSFTQQTWCETGHEMRSLYTLHRLRNNHNAAKQVEAEPEEFKERRVEIGRARHPELYAQPDFANELAICRDVYTNAHENH